MYETGQRGAEILRRILEEGASPVSSFVRLPVVLPPERANTQATPEEVAAGAYSAWPPRFLAQAQALEAEPWCLSAGVAMTQPWLRVDNFGSSILVTAADPSALSQAKQAAEELAAGMWEARESFLPSGDSLLPHADAVAEAARHAQQPDAGLVVIGDGADATTSGAPGDSTQLLQEVMKHSWPKSALVAINSPEGVQAAVGAGLGNSVTVTVGGVL